MEMPAPAMRPLDATYRPMLAWIRTPERRLVTLVVGASTRRDDVDAKLAAEAAACEAVGMPAAAAAVREAAALLRECPTGEGACVLTGGGVRAAVCAPEAEDAFAVDTRFRMDLLTACA